MAETVEQGSRGGENAETQRRGDAAKQYQQQITDHLPPTSDRHSLHPFLYLTAALVAGILADRWSAPGLWVVAALALSSIVFSIIFILGRRVRAATIAILMSLIAAGALLSSAERNSIDDARLGRLFDAGTITPDDPVELTGRLLTPPEPAPQLYYLDVEAESLRSIAGIIQVKGRARLMLPINDDEAANGFARLALDRGSRVRVLVRLERARNYDNPGSPDFNDFLERSGYDLKGIIKSPLLVECVGRADERSLLTLLYRARLTVMRAIDERFDPPVAGTLKAMLMGNRHYLERETVERLRESATYHTLAISGMHVGIIAWMLLGRNSVRRRLMARILFSLMALWAYAIMVGLAPPVTRATMMITVGIIGPLLFRRAASINTVALAAFIMLALKPSLAADPGFQMSFAAVAAIVALALPFIEKLRAIGEWRPTPQTPHPPSCSHSVRAFAEALFWDDRRFRAEMRASPVRYRLDKTRAARVLGLLRAQTLSRAIVLLAITSAAIQLTTLPLMVFYFNRVAPIGVLLNVMAGMLTALLMAGALSTLLVGFASAWLAAKFALIIAAAHYLLVNSVVPFANLPAATFRAAHYEGEQIIIYALYFVPLVLLAVLIDRWHPVDRISGGVREWRSRGVGEWGSGGAKEQGRRKSPRLPRPSASLLFLLCIASLIASMIVVVRPMAGSANGNLTVHFLDVGQGDSTLIVFPQGTTMLIDAGGEIRFNRQTALDATTEKNEANAGHEESEEVESNFRESAFSVGESVVSRFLWSLGITQIDYALVTHTDADHIGGFSDVIRNFSIGQAITGYAPAADIGYARFVESLAQRGIPLSVVNSGERYEIEGVSIEILWPPSLAEPPATSGNDDSVVLRLVYGEASVLLTGDIEQTAEDALVRSGVDLRADILKAPHHGSRTSSSEEFVNAARPRYAVIPAGKRNPFGHPDPSIVNRYRELGVKLFETGRDGMVTVETDGATIDVSAHRR